MGPDGWSRLPAGEAAGRTGVWGGREVMRAHVSDGEEFFFPYHGRLDMSSPLPPSLPGPLSFLSCCQSGLMRPGGASVLGRAEGMRDAAPQQLSVRLAAEDTEHGT